MNNRLFIVIAFAFLFTSCSMHEEIDISTEGNGYYQVSADLSAMMEMMKGMSASAATPDSTSKQVLDTTFSTASLIDSVGGDFTPEEKAYFYNGTMKIKMDMPAGKMDVVMRFPVKNAADLQTFLKVWTKVDSLSEIKKKQQEVPEEQPGQMPNLMNPSGGLMSPGNLPVKPSPYIITDTSIQRIALTKEDIMKDMGEAEQGLSMFASQMNFMTTIKLPHPVKKLEGKKVKLGDDKRTVFYSATLQELLDDPEAGEFRIIY